MLGLLLLFICKQYEIAPCYKALVGSTETKFKTSSLKPQKQKLCQQLIELYALTEVNAYTCNIQSKSFSRFE